MNWIVLAIAVYLMLVCERGLDGLVAIGSVTPSLTLILAVYLALSAPLPLVPWIMMLLGLIEDLGHPYHAHAAWQLTLIGPYTLGYLAAGHVAGQMRWMISRRSVVGLVIMVWPMGLFVHLVVVAMVTLRGLTPLSEPVADWRSVTQLLDRFQEILYTAVVTFPIGHLLLRSQPLWHFVGNRHVARSSRRNLRTDRTV